MNIYLKRMAMVTLAACGVLMAAINVLAIPPTDEAVAKWKAEGVWDEKVAQWHAFKANGGCAPNEKAPYDVDRVRQRIASGIMATETLYVPVILVDFPDLKYDQASYAIPGGGTLIQRAIGTAGKFDTLLFGMGKNPTGSMTEFFYENSYQKLYVTGVVMGWYTMPNNYSYYVGGDNGLGLGGPLLAKHAINTADSLGNNFTIFDHNDDGFIDGVVLIHAGPGAETGAYGIWSHKSSPAAGTVAPDGKFIETYTLNPEELGNGLSTVGVFCHEYGHVMGLPDLYDINSGNSPDNDGLGRWSLMAGGSWNGPGSNGAGPASMDAWCKYRLGFNSPIELTANMKQAPIPSAQVNPTVYWLWNTAANALEYWLVENRQRKGFFDTYLPGSGLCIYHYDAQASTNDNPARLRVSMEQADGLYNLEYAGSSGDAADPFPGTTNNRSFTDRTTPNSKYNVTLGTSQIGVWNISNADSVMYADLDIRWSRPYITMLPSADSIIFSDATGGDNDGIPEPGETIDFDCQMENSMLMAGYGHVHLEANDPNLVWVRNDVRTSVIFNPAFDVSLNESIRFSLPSSYQTSNVTFTMTVWVDSSFAATDSMYSFTFTFTKTLGTTQILVVDDDNGQSQGGIGYQKRVTDALDRLRFPYDTWTKLTQGSPTAGDLTPYRSIIWFTGPSDTTTGANYGGVLTTADVTAMKAFLDNGGGLLLSGVTVAQQLSTLDMGFLNNYMHAAVAGYIPEWEFSQQYWGIDGSPICAGTKYQFGSSFPIFWSGALLAPVNGGVPEIMGRPELAQPGQQYGIQAVSFSGGYQTLLMSIGIETFNDGLGAQGWAPKDTLLQRALAYFAEGQATGVDDGKGDGLPASFALAQNYPNPFNPSTTISYTITATDRPVKTRLEILNMLGQRVTTLVDRPQTTGTYAVTWDGTDARGKRVASGTYFYRLVAGDKSETKKMLFIK